MGKKISKVIIPLCISIFCTMTSNDKVYSESITKINNIVIANENKEDENQIKEEVKQIPKNNYTKSSWNVSALYKNEEEWKKELKNFQKDSKELKNYIGKVTESKTHLGFALDIKEKLDVRMNKLCAYVKLKQDTNKSSYKYLNMNDTMEKMYRDYTSIGSDLELEILKLSDKEYDEIMSNNKIKKKYGMYLVDIRRSKKHYLDD
ncbi:MAG: oligoendopeptidase F, partial [Romboutsia sp.]